MEEQPVVPSAGLGQYSASAWKRRFDLLLHPARGRVELQEPMEEQPVIPSAEALKYISAWKSELDLRQKELYSRFFSGAMGGVVTIVLSAGLALDKLAKSGSLVRIALGLSLLLLLLGAGNILNCFRLAVDGQLLLLAKERDILLTQTKGLPRSDLQQLGDTLTRALGQVQRFYGYSYFAIALAVIVGAVTFFVTLFSA